MSCQLRKQVACGHAPVMICDSSNDLPCRVETLSLDKQGLCVRFRRKSRRATPYGEAQLLCLRWGLCHVGLVLCSHIVGRANFMCVRFSQRIRHRRLVFPGVGPPCVLTKFSVPSHMCFCVSILGSANDVLPLMVLVNVGCNTVEENNTYRPLCKVLWVC